MFDWKKQWIRGNDFDTSPDPNEIIGTKGIPTGNLACGVGHIIIPAGVDPNDYTEDVYRTGRVSISGGMDHPHFHNCLIDREVLQRIKIPSVVGKLGSPIVWINLPKHNEPIIIATLKHEDDFHPLSENQKRTTRVSNLGDMVDIDMNPENGILTITVLGKNQEKIPRIHFRIAGTQSDGQFIVESDGDYLMRASNKVVQMSDKTFELGVNGIDGVSKARIKMNSNDEEETERFIYEDEWGNKVYINENRIQIKAEDSSKIVFGEEDSAEPMVKGETLVGKIEEIIDAITQLTVPTAFGPSGTPINSATFIQIKSQLDTILSELTNTD